MYQPLVLGIPPLLTGFTHQRHSGTRDERSRPRPSTVRWSIVARVALRSQDEIMSRPFRLIWQVIVAEPALADTILSIAAITGCGDSSSLERRLALMSGTTCSWRGTPSPPSTTGAWKKGTGVSFGNFNQDLRADRTVRSTHLRYLANYGERAN